MAFERTANDGCGGGGAPEPAAATHRNGARKVTAGCGDASGPHVAAPAGH